MYELKKNWEVIYRQICWDQALVLWKKNLPGPRLTKKEFTGPSSYEKRIFRALVLRKKNLPGPRLTKKEFTGPSSYEKRIFRALVLRKKNLLGRGLTKVKEHWSIPQDFITLECNFREQYLVGKHIMHLRCRSVYFLTH
jgi:hypothetical protein